jgi:hypothetical protein
MRTSRIHLPIFVVLTIALVPSLALGGTKADTPTQQVDAWSSINSVPTGDRLSVELKKGQTIDGKLTSISDSTLSLTVKGKSLEVKRDDVSRVYHVVKKSAAKSTLIGLGVGAGAGAAIGLAGDANDNSGFEKIDHAVTAGLTVLGAGAGAAIGYLLGRSSRKRVLIYQAP